MVQKPVQLDDDLHKALKLASAEEGTNIKEFIKGCLLTNPVFKKRYREITKK